MGSRGEKDLHAAARSGELNNVRAILSSNPLAVNSRDKHSRTPLHLAAWSGHTEVVSYLCKEKADVGGAAMDDMGAIHFAAQKGHLEVVRTLLSSGVSVKASNRKGLSPLHYASQGSHMELVKYLVRKGANLDAKTKAGKTPRDLARSDEIRLLLEEYEMSAKKENLSGDQKAKKSDPMLSGSDKAEKSYPMLSGSDKAEKSPEVESAAAENDEQGDEMGKRKVDEDNMVKTSTRPKKAKVALNHLLSEDDTQEDETL